MYNYEAVYDTVVIAARWPMSAYTTTLSEADIFDGDGPKYTQSAGCRPRALDQLQHSRVSIEGAVALELHALLGALVGEGGSMR